LPFIPKSCINDLACAFDCKQYACSHCSDAQKGSCESEAQTVDGICGNYLEEPCLSEALSSGATPCYKSYLDQYGDWMNQVGSLYCGNGKKLIIFI
jgi:hypothetical protein